MTWRDCSNVFLVASLLVIWLGYKLNITHRRKSVCMVRKRDTGQVFAMKYMNKCQCVQRDALRNVLREVEILTTLEHPFLVNLWFTFQDEEDLFMVSDLLDGGDLRFHIALHSFSEESVQLYVCEVAMALDYLQGQHIVHRDIKPDNILLDEAGHAHITDFNIAAVLEPGQLATSMSGTKPYMAPEIFDCAVDECVGYSYPVDWWSLGVCAYELLHKSRPYEIHSATSISEVRGLFTTSLHYPVHWSAETRDLLSRLLCPRPGARISSLQELRKVPGLASLDMDAVLQKKVQPPYLPAKNKMNYDPSYELEEMIIETRPLHKKKKRLAKQRSLREVQGSPSVDLDSDVHPELHPNFMPEFTVYNRERELERRARERKERAWEQELQEAMEASGLDRQLERSASLSSGSAPKGPCTAPDATRGHIRRLNSTPLSKRNEKTVSSPAHCGVILSADNRHSTDTKSYVGKHVLDSKTDQNYTLDYIDRTPSPEERSTTKTNAT